MKRNFLLIATLLLELLITAECSNLVAYTFGNSHADSIIRQMQSANDKNVDLHVIDLDTTVSRVTGSKNIETMKDYLDALRSNKETIVMFVESGGLFLNTSEEIVRRFKQTGAQIFISAESDCRPDESLNVLFPNVSETEKRFVGRNGIIGYAELLFGLLTVEHLQPIEDVQFYLTKAFIDVELREKYGMKLDTKSEIFQNLDGKRDEVSIEYTQTGEGYLTNVFAHSTPAIVQPSSDKDYVNALSNYIGHAWDPVYGEKQFKNRLNFSGLTNAEYPSVTVAIFIDQPTPFLTEYFKRIVKLSYPKSRISLLISNSVKSHEKLITNFIDVHGNLYGSLAYMDSDSEKSLLERRTHVINSFETDFALFIDSLVHLTNEMAIENLVSYNASLIAPLVSRRGELWSNFWGATAADGYYSRSFDYLEIVNRERTGVWNVPVIAEVFLVKKSLQPLMEEAFSPLTYYKDYEVDLTFSRNLRERDIFLLLTNEERYGYLVNGDQITTEHLHNDLWEIFSNPLDWKEKYIHENYSKVADESVPMKMIEQPCPDVFWWPFVSATFAKHLIEEMEYFGKWSDGSNKDPRLEGGYENVPTRDIHMRQVDWEEHWMRVLKTFVYPMQTKLFQGYYDEPRARMNFVVRYKPTEQDRLRPHHDASSYTLNIALNKPGVDYEGGGARYNRYNCDIVDSRVGWVLMSPGRVTHLHEGLPTTNGTRYIFVTFVNP